MSLIDKHMLLVL